jgi:hypothetical protein
MQKDTNPYGRKTMTGDFGSYFNVMYSYFLAVGKQPNVYEFGVVVKGDTPQKLVKIGFKRVFLCESETHSAGEVAVAPMEECYRRGDVFVYLYRRESILSRMEYMHPMDEDDEDDMDGSSDEDKETLYRCKILYASRDRISSVLSAIERSPEKKKKGRVHLLCNLDGMLHLQRFDVRTPPGEMDLGMNYGPEAALKFEKAGEALESNRKGLVLLSGDPGTGKSTFIKYLTKRTSRKVIYLASGAADHLTNPDFMTFIMRHRNCVLLLEDAEKALRSRDEQDNPAISNILNITDGILGDCLNIMVIATFNIDREKIDSALVRKGRLILEHHFGPLPQDAADRLLEKIGSENRASGPMTLAEIYNPDDNYHEEPEEKRKVGF